MVRRPPIRTRPAPRSEAPGTLAVAEPAAAGAASPAPDGAVSMESLLKEAMQELEQQFQAVLQDDASLDVETREQFGQLFQQALEDAAASPDLDAEPDSAEWVGAVEALRQGGGVADDEANQLIRRINDALAPLQRKESRLAMEFSRRLAADGQEKALAWLRDAREAEQRASKEAVELPRDNHPSLQDEVVNSRSRRLRGPPRRR